MCQGHHGKPGRYWSSPQSTTLCALPQEPASIHALFTGRLPTAPWFIPAALQPTKGTCLPWVRCQDCDAQCVAWTAYSPGQISLFSPFPEAQVPTWSLPFPSYLVSCQSFLQPWLQSFSVFSDHYFACRCIWCVCGRNYIILLHDLDQFPLALVFLIEEFYSFSTSV